MSRHIDYVIKNSDGLYLTREPIADRWSETLADAYIFHILNEAEDRRDAGDIPDAEVYQLSSAQRHVPRSYAFDVTIRVSSMNEEAAFRLLRKMSETLGNEYDYARDENGHSKFESMYLGDEQVLGFEYDGYGNEIDE